MAQAEQTVFYLDALCTMKLLYGFSSELILRDKLAGLQHIDAFDRGELSLEEMPDRMALNEDASRLPPAPLPHIFVAGDYLSISNTVAEVLRSFDLGASLIKPVVYLNQDQKTPMAHGWNLLQIKEFKTGLEMDHSKDIPERIFKRPEIYPLDLNRFTKSTRAAMNPSVLFGPDLWVDRRVDRSIFVSAALFDSLHARKLLGPIRHLACPVLAPDSLKTGVGV